MAALTSYSLTLLVGTAVKHGKKSYEDLCVSAFGATGLIVVSVSRFMFSGGSMVSYLIILGDTLSAVFDAAGCTIRDKMTTRRVVIGTSAVLLMLPLVLLRDITHLSKTSVLSVSTVFAMELVVIAQAATRQHLLFEQSCSGVDHLCEESYPPGEGPAYEIVPFGFRHFFSAFGIFAFAFTCHDSSFIIFGSMREMTIENWQFTTRVSVVIAGILCALMAIPGYLTFTTRTDPDLLNNYPGSDALIMVMRVMYALTMVLTYPMCFNVCRDVLHGLWVMRKHEKQRRNPSQRVPGIGDNEEDSRDTDVIDKSSEKQQQLQLEHQEFIAERSVGSVPYPTDIPIVPHLLFTLPLFVVSVSIALVVTDLGMVLQLTGGLAATTVGCILPAACALKLDHYAPDRHSVCSLRAALGPCLLFVFGVAAAAISTVDTLSSPSV
jgi:sodium-coupled neutral amino acid transporter 11